MVENNTLCAKHCFRAQTFWQRLRGLLGTVRFPDSALLIPNCRSIHTFFMLYPIDVIFLDQQNTIVDLYPNVRPFSLRTCRVPGDVSVLELPVGTVKREMVGWRFHFPTFPSSPPETSQY